jgi:hypothetical protein
MAARKARDRFVKLTATGRELSSKAKKWTLVLDRETKLIWPKSALPCGRLDWDAAKKAASACRLGKHVDWRLPSQKELQTLVDFSCSTPAIDMRFFECEPAFHWSSTPLASSPGDFAWLVHFNGGSASCGNPNGTAFVRPVRSARASQ